MLSKAAPSTISEQFVQEAAHLAYLVSRLVYYTTIYSSCFLYYSHVNQGFREIMLKYSSAGITAKT